MTIVDDELFFILGVKGLLNADLIDNYKFWCWREKINSSSIYALVTFLTEKIANKQLYIEEMESQGPINFADLDILLNLFKLRDECYAYWCSDNETLKNS